MDYLLLWHVKKNNVRCRNKVCMYYLLQLILVQTPQ